jgi:hypothetical protein
MATSPFQGNALTVPSKDIDSIHAALTDVIGLLQQHAMSGATSKVAKAADLAALPSKADLGSYLPLAGGTMTGALAGTTAAFSAGLLGPYLIARDEQASGTAGGTATSGAWRQRNLSVIPVNRITGASLTSNQITLPAGTYRATIRAMFGAQVSVAQCRLYDTTNSAALVLGSNAFSSSNGSYASTYSAGTNEFTLASSAVVELEYQVSSTKSSDGLGRATSWGTEVYAEVVIARLS